LRPEIKIIEMKFSCHFDKLLLPNGTPLPDVSFKIVVKTSQRISIDSLTGLSALKILWEISSGTSYV
jgi:hypothetical protein